MTDIQLYTKIAALPDNLKAEVSDFIDFLANTPKSKKAEPRKSRMFGFAKDAIVIHADFDEPLEDFKPYME
jgi:hypothetical protein